MQSAISRTNNQQETRAQREGSHKHGTGGYPLAAAVQQRSLWFQFTPRQLAALYNERHPLSETLHLEQNGMAFSPSVPERTPSTAITRDGQAWVDFSARSMQPDGKHDGGDALELAARRNGESKAAKSNTLREAARMLVREARAALEGAARAGEEPPTWVAQIMTEAGWQRYHSSVQNPTASPYHQQGGNWFSPAGMTTHAAQEQITSTSERNSTQRGCFIHDAPGTELPGGTCG